MNRDNAKKLLMRYRPGTTDGVDADMAEALKLAGKDPETGRWLENHHAQQNEVRQTLRKITAPAGLLEQIVSEHKAQEKIIFWRQRTILFAAAAAVVAAVLLGLPFWLRQPVDDGTSFAVYQDQMAARALRGYGMDLNTGDPEKIRHYLAQHQAPADYVLPGALQKADVAGCAIESWEGVKISMICFRTGRPLAPGVQSDLWLFVIDQASVKNVPAGSIPQISKINRLATATWHQDGKLYLLGSTADETVLRKFL